MNMNVIKVLLVVLFASCNVSNSISQISKNEIVYAITINKDQYEPIYNILKENLKDFPENKNKKIKFFQQINDGIIKIRLTKNKLKMIHRNTTETSEQFEAIISEIKKIKDVTE